MNYVDENIEELIRLTKEYMAAIKLLAVYKDEHDLLRRKAETQIQNCSYFAEGLREHIICND